MALTLSSVILGAFRQALPQVLHLLDKAQAHCDAHGLAPEGLIEARLAPDMLPFAYQVKSTAVHSLGAIAGVRAGIFSPDTSVPPADFLGLRERVSAALAGIEAIDPAEMDGLSGRDMRLQLGEMRLDFSAEDFLLSFALPNFYFHVTTAYDILRANGVAIGKRDYIGRPRTRAPLA